MNNCKTILPKKCCKDILTATIAGNENINNVSFPETPCTGSLYIVKFDDSLVIYKYQNGNWDKVIDQEQSEDQSPKTTFTQEGNPYEGQYPSVDGENIGDTNITQYNEGTLVGYTWNGTSWNNSIIIDYPYIDFDWYNPFKNNNGDNSLILLSAIQDAKDKNKTLIIRDGNYLINQSLEIVIDKDLSIKSYGTFLTSSDIIFNGQQVLSTTLKEDITVLDKNIKVNNNYTYNSDDVLLINGNICAEVGWHYPYKEIQNIKSSVGDTIYFDDALNFSIKKDGEWKLKGDGIETRFFVPYYYTLTSNIQISINGVIQSTGIAFVQKNTNTPITQSGFNGLDVIFNTPPVLDAEVKFTMLTGQSVLVHRSKKLLIDGLKILHQTNSGNAILFTNLKNSNIQNIEVKGTSGLNLNAIGVRGCINFKIKDVRIENCGYGISVGQSRNTNCDRIYGNNSNHLILTENFAINTVGTNLNAINCLNIADAHPSFDTHYENVFSDSGNYPSMRCDGFSLINIKSNHESLDQPSIGGSIDWIDNLDYPEYSFLLNSSFLNKKIAIDKCDLPKYNATYNNFGKMTVTNSIVGHLAVYGTIEGSPKTYHENEILISNSKFDTLTQRDGKLSISNSTIGKLNLVFPSSENVSISNSELGIKLDKTRSEYAMYVYGELLNRSSLLIDNTYITAYRSLFEYYEAFEYINFNNCVLDSIPNIYKTSTNNYPNGYMSFNNCVYKNSYGSLLRFNITNQGAGYTSATISIPLPTDNDIYEMRDGYKALYPNGDVTPKVAVVSPIIQSGQVVDYEILNGGQGYYDFNTYTIATSGDGSNFSIANIGRYPKDRIQEKITHTKAEGAEVKNTLGAELISENYVWFDSTNTFRYKDGIPTNETDGTVIGGTSLPSLTSGSVVFSNGTTISQDNTNLFWDNTNNRLGIGNNTPTDVLHVVGDTNLQGIGGSSIFVQDGQKISANTSLFIDTQTSGLIYFRPGINTVLSLNPNGHIVSTTVPSFSNTAAASGLTSGTIFRVTNGDGTATLHIKE